MSLDDLTMLGAQVGAPAPPSVGAEIASLADDEARPPRPTTIPKQTLLAPDGPVSARQRHLEFKATQPGATPRDVRSSFQTVTPRQANIMAASSYEDVAQAIQPDDDPLRTGARSVAFEVYSNRVPGAEAAQVDFARFDHAYQQGVIQDERSKQLWSKMTSGQLLTEDETEELSSSVQSFAETLDESPSDDLSVGLTGRVAAVQRVADGLATRVDHPLGWDDGRAADPEVRQERIKRVNLASMAERGAKNLATIYALASHADMAPVEGDSLEPFVGAVLDLPEAIANATVEESYRDLAEQTGQSLGEVKGIVRAGWESLVKDQAGSWADGTPFALPSDDGANPIVEALLGRTEGPYSLQAAAGLRLPAEALDSAAGDGMSSLALPDGTVVYAAPISDDSAAMARHLYPAVVGADRVPRWVPSTPMKVTDALRQRRIQSVESHYDAFVGSDLKRAGGHPLFKPGNYITFETADDRPVHTAGESQDLGRVTREAPGLSRERLEPKDLDPNKFLAAKDSPLATHAWATFDSTGPGKAWVAELRRRGYPTIPTETGFLVFGINPDEAEAIAEDQPVSVTTPVGGDGGPRRVRVGDQDVVLNPQDWVPDVAPRRRRATTRRRVEVTVPKGLDPARMAKELEAQGATNLSIYAHAKNLDGYERAYETAYDDGIETIVVRHAKGDLASAHGGQVFVKSTKGLPDGPGGAEKAPPVEQPEDPLDLIPAVQAAHDAGTAKVAGYDVVQPQGLERPKELTKDRHGVPVPTPRRDRPKPQWEEDFGVEFDPAWRVGNKVQELPADVQAALYRTFSSFQDDQTVARFGPSRIVVSFVDGDEPAVTEWKTGGAIVLNRDADPKALPAALRRELEAIRDEW